MADSENSRTLSPVTCRGLLSGTAVWLEDQIANTTPDCDVTASGGVDERVRCIWRAWMATHRKLEELCKAQQRLERRLVAAIGFPRVEISAADMERPAAAFTAGEIDSLLGGGTDGATSEGSLPLSASCALPGVLVSLTPTPLSLLSGRNCISGPFKDRLNGVQICGCDGGRRVLCFRAAHRRNADNRRTGKVFSTPANKSPRCSYLGSINRFHFIRFSDLNVFHSYDTKRFTTTAKHACKSGSDGNSISCGCTRCW